MSATFLLEIRVEELPAASVLPAVHGLADAVRSALSGVTFGEVHTWSTPRRLAVVVHDVAPARERTEREVTGPPASRAKDAQGQWTAVATGFARGQGVEVDALYEVELPKRGAVLAARVAEGGESTVELLRAALEGIVAAVPFKKTMHWADGETLAFARPLRGICALWDGQPLGGICHGLPVTGQSTGHRLSPELFTVTDEESFVEGLRAHGVEPDRSARKAKIASLLAQASSELGADPIVDEALLEEVTDLTESPDLVIGTFDRELLDLPSRLLITSMKVNQRYFPVHKAGQLTEHFVVISNNPRADRALVAEGNARVLRARFYDARFFLSEDHKTTLARMQDKLETRMWMRGAGSMADKARRLQPLAARIAETFGATQGETEAAAAAGLYAKADLASLMVGEFPELQGHVGHLYARHDGLLNASAALAIEEQYYPRFSGDTLPQTLAGRALALADRLDTLVGAFAVGDEPRGGADPLGLRRAAAGVVEILLAQDWRGDLGRLVEFAVDTFDSYVQTQGERGAVAFDRYLAQARSRTERVASLCTFVLARFRARAIESGVSADVVDAALAGRRVQQSLDLGLVARVIESLRTRAGTDRFEQLLTLVKRVRNIVGERPQSALPADLPEPEAALGLAVSSLSHRLKVYEQADPPCVGESLDDMVSVVPAVACFFEDVLVQDASDPVGTERRLDLLGALKAALAMWCDLSLITTR